MPSASPRLLTLALSALLALSSLAQADGELKRGAYLGTKLTPLGNDARQAAKLAEDDGGILVDEILPGSSAEASGLKKGDVILSVDGTKLTNPASLVKTVVGKKAGDAIKVEVVRDGARSTKTIDLKARPLETSDDHEVIYGSVTSRGHKLRTIVTKPKGSGRHPALFFIQGIGMYSVDNPTGGLASYRTILDDFTKRGWVTLRVEKPGVGDSEGGPADEVDLEAELDGYRQGLKMLKGMDSVDPDKVVLFGHSMGGVMAPLLSLDVPVKGIAAYGTISRTWWEYLPENLRRQMALGGADPAEIDRAVPIDMAFTYLSCREKLSPAQIAEKYSDLREHVAEISPDGKTYFGRHYSFFPQLASKNLADAWTRFDGHALAMWGRSDFVSAEADHKLVADYVNRNHPDHGTFAPIDGADHGFNRAASFEESLRHQGPGEFHPAVLETLRSWADKVVASQK